MFFLAGKGMYFRVRFSSQIIYTSNTSKEVARYKLVYYPLAKPNNRQSQTQTSEISIFGELSGRDRDNIKWMDIN
jgi:hypothetical protein